MKLAVVIAAVVAALLFGRRARRWPRVQRAMLFLVAFLPFTELVERLSLNLVSHETYRGDARGFEVTIVEVLALALAVALPKARWPVPYRGVALLYIAVAAVSVFYAWSHLYAAFGLWKVLRGFFLAVVLARACEDERVPPVLLTGLAWGLIVQVGYALVERYVQGGYQISGSFEHQNTLGMAVNLVLPIFLALLMGRGSKKWLAGAALISGVVCVLLTLSRGAMVMLPVGLGIVYVGSLIRDFSWRKLQVGIVGIAIGIGLLVKSFDTIVLRFLYAPEESGLGREMYEQASAAMLGDHFFGVGINNFALAVSEGGYGEAAGLAGYDATGLVHHIYWLTAAEMGWLGLLAWVLLTAAPLVVAFKGLRLAADDVRGEVMLGCLAGLSVTAVHGVLEWLVRQTHMTYLLWMVAVLALSLYRQMYAVRAPLGEGGMRSTRAARSGRLGWVGKIVGVGAVALGLTGCGSGCLGSCGGGQGTTAAAQPALRAPERSSSLGSLSVRVERVSSDTAYVKWPAVPGAESVRIVVGAEPPADAQSGRLEPAVRLASLPGETTAHRLEGLSAAADVFVRVEVRAKEGLRWGVTHARTLGGPGTALATPLREVHAFGPEVLMLVLENRGVRWDDGELEGDTGPAWQGGRWTVQRHDGSALKVEAVHRHSLPVRQPDYEVEFGEYGDGNVLDVDHRIFLELAEPLGARDVLRVRHEGEIALDVRVPYSDRYLETPLVQLNQLGYNPRASRRWAYVSGWMGDGGPADLSGLPAHAEVLAEPLDPLEPRRPVTEELALTVRRQKDAEAGGEVRAIDLSSVPAAEGVRYRVRIPGVGVSWPTAVSEEAAVRAFWTVARGLYLNRFCGELDEEHTDWSRPADHCEAYFVKGRDFSEGMFPEDTAREHERPLVGGHHDAGDFDIRAYHVVVAQYLMRAYELEPGRFADGQLAIPESGNGIPDLLDEALWSVAGWEALQREDGAVRAGVESYRHPAGIYFAHDDELPYWTFDPVPWHTAYVAALFAQASRLLAPFDAARARELRQRAVRAYGSSVGRRAPDAHRLYAASELFALTGETRFGRDFEALWRGLDKYGRGAFDRMQPMPKIYDGAFAGSSPVMADFVMGYATSEGADPAIVRVVREQLSEHADGMTRALLGSPHGHRSGRPRGEPHAWGQVTSTGRQADTLYQRLQLEGLPEPTRQRYFDAMSVAADYALGANPAGYVWISGLGSRSPMQPLHLDSLAFQKKKGMPPIPGIPVFGPVDDFPGQYYYRPMGAAFHPGYEEHPPGNRVCDTHASVAMNEFSVWTHQAPMTLLFAALLGEDAAPPASWKAGGDEHRATLPSHTREP